MNRLYDRNGEPLELMAWATAFEDAENKQVAHDVLNNGKRVSTVWLGLDHQFGDGPPLIFESMVFSTKLVLARRFPFLFRKTDFDELDTRRYATEAEAVAGHRELVAKWQ